MVQFINLKSINNNELNTILQNLSPISGYCIFIDIVGSSAIKYNHGVKEWINIHKNTFSIFSELIGIHNNIVKFIGDELMVFIPDSDLVKLQSSLKSANDLLIELFSSASILKNFPIKDRFLSCKIAICYCTEVYNVSFLENVNDFYGKEIDLCSRLMQKTEANTIIFNSQFYSQLQESNAFRSSPLFEKISDLQTANFSGIPHDVEFFSLKVE